ncbi:hypothetical protein, partial [Rhizobium sp. LjRoot98]|uniref:hypothetical protein n=1 Tax=Rhizobium sp. LjRoot98 TaxID=3342345 RepID=UPI003F50AA8C
MEKISIALGCNISELFVGLPERFAVLLENTLPCRFVDHGPSSSAAPAWRLAEAFLVTPGEMGT